MAPSRGARQKFGSRFSIVHWLTPTRWRHRLQVDCSGNNKERGASVVCAEHVVSWLSSVCGRICLLVTANDKAAVLPLVETSSGKVNADSSSQSSSASKLSPSLFAPVSCVSYPAMSVRVQFENNNEIGVFARLTNKYCLVAIGGSENFYSVFEGELSDHIPVVHTSIAGCRIVGEFAQLNRGNFSHVCSLSPLGLVPAEPTVFGQVLHRNFDRQLSRQASGPSRGPSEL